MEIGDKIDNYQITEVLSGGMSEVYRVFDGTTRYVLKRLKEGSDEIHKKLFKREIRILKSLVHPNIIEILHDTYDSDTPYYVMPNCGKSFVDIASNGVDEIEKINYSIDFCNAVYYAHENGVFHRDIKPQNVLLFNNQVKVSDFGLSRFESRDTTTLTTTSLTAGTNGYMPPEYRSGAFKDGTVAADIYMIGKTLYYLFSSAKDVSNIRNEYVSPQIANIVDLCTRNDPNDRIQSVNDIIGLLHEYKSQIMAVRNAPKRIKEIKQNYRSGSPEFNEEVYKSLMAHDNNPITWGESLSQLRERELIAMLTYKKHLVPVLANHFMECIMSPSDYVQFSHVDSYAKFSKAIIIVCPDTGIRQNVLLFIIKESICFNRYPAMQIIADIFRGLQDDEINKMALFIRLHKDELNQITEALGRSPFDGRVNALLK